jgi:hypothetical protein
MTTPAFLILSVVAALPASAALLVYDGFDYAVAANGLNTQNGGFGFTTPWTANTGSPTSLLAR